MGRYVVIFSVMFIGISTAQAGVIDLRDLPGNIDQAVWGQPGTALYAQSLTADEDVLSIVSMRATAMMGDIHFNILVTGIRFDFGGGQNLAPDFADIRYNSGMRTIVAGSGLTETTVFPAVPVKNGEQIFVVFDVFSYPGSGMGTMRATVFSGLDRYSGGEFVYLNTAHLQASSLLELNSERWAHRGPVNQDLAIFAEFGPEPASALLLLAGVLMARRTRNHLC